MPVLQKSLREIKLSHGTARRLATRSPHRFSIASILSYNLFSLSNVDSLWATFTLAFFGFLRSSESTCSGNFDPQSHLARTDISCHPNILHPTSFDTAIKKSKTNPFWETARLTIARSNSDLCASSALQDYMLQTATQDPGQLLFSFSCGPNLTQTSHTNNVWPLINLCNIDSSSPASYSFSIGATTTAGATGILGWLVKFWVTGNLTHTKLTSGLPRKQYVRFLQSSASCSSF